MGHSRPRETGPSARMEDVRTLEGDPHIAICRPAVPVDTPSRNLKFSACGIRKDGTLYANIESLPPVTPSQDQPVAYLFFRFQDKSGHFLFDQFTASPAQSSDEPVYFGRDKLAQLGTLSCGVAALGSDVSIGNIYPGNELRPCPQEHGRPHVDFGLDYHFRSLAIGNNWVAIRFDGYMNTFFNPQSPHTMQDARFFTRLDHAAPVDTLLSGDDPVASLMYPNAASGLHWLHFGTDDSWGAPETFWRICFEVPK